MIGPNAPGLFAVSAITEHAKRDALQRAILREIESLCSADFSSEITKATRMTLVTQFRTLTTASGRASDLASNWHETRNLNYTRDYIEQLSHVTGEDLQRVARTYLVPNKLTITSLDPEGSEETHTADSTLSARGEIQTRTLENGLTLITQRDSRLPTVSITLATLTGLPSETPTNSGINSLLAKLLTKGTQHRSAEEIATTMDTMGATFGVNCGNNTTLTSASCLQPDLDATLEIIADFFQHPLLPDDALQRERDAMIAALKEQEEDPLSVAFRHLRPSLFGKTGYGLNAGGTESSLLHLTRDDLSAHHHKHFTARNSVIAVFGDIDPDAAADMVSRHFSAMPTGERNTYAPQEIPEPTSHTLHLDKEQAVLTLGFIGAGVSDDDTYALELIHDYCTDMAGPLFTKIREELGLAYYVSATQFHGIYTGMLAFYLGTSPDHLDTAKAVLLDEIATIAEHGIPEEAFQNVKTSWLASHALSNQKIASLARLSAIDSLLGFEASHHLQAPDRIRELTREDIRRVARKFLSPAPAIVTVSPKV